MRLIVLGANGGTGQQVVRAALQEGMDVTAVVRRPDAAVGITHTRLNTAVGDPCDAGFLESLLPGHDAVISTLGGKRPTKAATSVTFRSAEAIVDAAKSAGVKRVLVVSTALLFPQQPFAGKILRRLVHNVVRSAERMELVLKSSSLSWTIVRPGFLSNADTKAYRFQRDAAPPEGTSVSRRALAVFLLDALADPEAERGVFGVSAAKSNASRRARD